MRNLTRNYDMTMFKETGIRQQVIDEIIQIAKLNHVEKVILFGSRARGDYKERSDIDLAFSGGNSSEFILTVDEETYTLLKFDVVDLEKPVRNELRESIEREGMVIYEEIWEFQGGIHVGKIINRKVVSWIRETLCKK